MTANTEVAEKLESYIRAQFFVADDDDFFTRDVHLWKEGYVDSTGAVEVIAFLEDEFQIRLPDEVLFDPNFTTINGMADRVAGLIHG
ncbi:acyl carrier protein [Acanthopleuribacter pedis]|uniref:Acyl carrier protein n=1 Tax=Acanthopleuribacter pedis TaxID=442870 RepID=A0A8J7Q9B8_9BACT|nr:acyl carrier protein [Acanthopleuribacter pedis]MBO1321016.1 acyl carrier protein [Acanthopleuribacter pedis]